METPHKPVDVGAFCASQLEFLAAELQSEVDETTSTLNECTPAALQRAGRGLINLQVDGRRTGMGGRTLLTLSLDTAVRKPAAKSQGGGHGSSNKSGNNGDHGDNDDGSQLPEHGLRSGDIVLVGEQPGGSAKKVEIREMEQRGLHGVVARIYRGKLDVALDLGHKSSGGGKPEDGRKNEDEAIEPLLSGRVYLAKVADDVTYKRMTAAIQKLQAMPEASYTNLIQVLFGQSTPVVDGAVLREDVQWVDPTLNSSQQEAVRFALAAREVALIHGPPGTGKTHTLIELILQMVRRGQRILVCGPSNISVDNLVERLSPHGVPMLRLGHPARVLPSVLNHALDMVMQQSDAGSIVRDVRADMDARQTQLRQLGKKGKGGGRKGEGAGAGGGGGGGRSARREIYTELRELRREYRERERRCVREVVAGSRVVLTTLHGAGSSQLRFPVGDVAVSSFDAVIIDEAAQALEAQCWVALLGARKVICAGDHLQLAPTIMSKQAGGSDKTGPDKRSRDKAFASGETTLFERMLTLHGESIKRMLTTQYRMHEQIMRFPSDTLYEGHLTAAEAVAGRLLRDLRYGTEDTQRAGKAGKNETNSGSSGVADTDDTREPLIFIDTQGGNFPETSESETPGTASSRSRLFGESKYNRLEAVLVRQHVRALVEAGVRPSDIAVITPYNAQVAQLAPLKTTYPGLEVGSVDGFQGREKEAVVLSLVRSNTTGEVGFLADKRRLNVAMTRSKRSLTVVGDSETVGRGGEFLKKWIRFLEEHADLRYPDAAETMEGQVEEVEEVEDRTRQKGRSRGSAK